jgi:hypothetical protein
MVEVSDRYLLLGSFPRRCRWWMCVPGLAISMAVDDQRAEGRRVLFVLIGHSAFAGDRREVQS